MLTSTFCEEGFTLHVSEIKIRYSRFWMTRKENIYEPRQATGYVHLSWKHGENIASSSSRQARGSQVALFDCLSEVCKNSLDSEDQREEYEE